VSKTPRRETRQGAMVVGRPRQHAQRHEAHNVDPTPPARQLVENVGTGKPNELGTRKPAAQHPNGIDGVARAQRSFDRRRDNPPAIGNGASRGEASGKRRHASRRLERIARRHEQPHLIEPKLAAREFGNMAMASMSRIEGAAEQANAHPPAIAVHRDAVADLPGQGRT
jgi:hypothetical protein